MKKSSCAISLVAILLFLVIGLSVLNYHKDSRTFILNKGCEIILKMGIDLDKDHCLKGIATFLENPEICKMITGDKFVTEYKGEFIQFENPPKMQCLTEIAAEKNDPSLCDNVNGVLVANTKIDCLYDVAAKNNNKEACNMIGDESQSRVGMAMNKDSCMAQLKNQ